MAKTAAITLGASSGTAPRVVNVICTVTNNDTLASVTGIQPTCVASSGATTSSCAADLGTPNIGPGMNTAVAGSGGTLALTWPAVIHNPWGGAGLAEPASQVYVLGALVYMSSGEVITASTSNFTASAPSHP